MAIDDDTPLRLADALALAFPNGGLTVAGMRKEAKRGRLEIERIANKDFTTLRAIREMRARCRIPANEVGVTPIRRSLTRAPEPGGLSPQEALRIRLEKYKQDRKAAEKIEREEALQRRQAFESERDATPRDALLARIKTRRGK